MELPPVPSDPSAPAVEPTALAIRRRDPAALQASRFLARYLVALPGALDDAAGEPVTGSDRMLVAALRPERVLPPAFGRLTDAIEGGDWGEGLGELGDSFGCDAVARDVLGLLVAPELDPEVRLAFVRALGP